MPHTEPNQGGAPDDRSRELTRRAEWMQLFGDFVSHCQENGFELAFGGDGPFPSEALDAFNQAFMLFRASGLPGDDPPLVLAGLKAQAISYDGESAMALILGEPAGVEFSSVAPAAALSFPHPVKGQLGGFAMPSCEPFTSLTGTIIQAGAGQDEAHVSVMLSGEGTQEAWQRVQQIARYINERSGSDPRSPVLSISIPSSIVALLLREVRAHEPHFLGVHRFVPLHGWQFEVGVVSLPELDAFNVRIVDHIQPSTHTVQLWQNEFGVLRAEWLGSVQS